VPGLLIISSEFPPGPGGIGTHAYQVALQLHALGWELAVLSPQDYASETEIAIFNAAQPFPIHRARHLATPFGELARRGKMLLELVKNFQPDIVLATGERSVWLMALCARLRSFRWVAIGHGTEFGIPSRWQAALTRRAFGSANMVICVSDYTRQRMLSYGVQPRQETVIPNGADESRFARLPHDAVQAFKIAHQLENKRLLITVGNVTERKGQDTIIRALPSIIEQFPDTHYLIVGLPTKQGDYQALAHELKVDEHVHFLGRIPQEDIVGYLNASDIFVMTSRHTSSGDFEGYGIAVIEAALCGKPAVVANNSGLREAIIDGETGTGVPEDDPQAAANAIMLLLADDQKRLEMGEAAYHRAAVEQTWRQRALIYDETFRKLLL
jgi:phosphatidylinositol alpha-1,6-mannosyltransferase